ncbi:MAG: hypothetical protein ACKOSQ_08890 [Planctomycetaceae bacterium]
MLRATPPCPTIPWLRIAARPAREVPEPAGVVPPRRLECVDPDDEEEELGDEEDLAVAQPLADEESNFDDFDDEFDDDFEEEENDPDWDHPEESDSDEMPPGKGPGRSK